MCDIRDVIVMRWGSSPWALNEYQGVRISDCSQIRSIIVEPGTLSFQDPSSCKGLAVCPVPRDTEIVRPRKATYPYGNVCVFIACTKEALKMHSDIEKCLIIQYIDIDGEEQVARFEDGSCTTTTEKVPDWPCDRLVFCAFNLSEKLRIQSHWTLQSKDPMDPTSELLPVVCDANAEMTESERSAVAQVFDTIEERFSHEEWGCYNQVTKARREAKKAEEKAEEEEEKAEEEEEKARYDKMKRKVA